jgi:CRP/FNR family transcriptional regulator, cyclic AMP receptor protein
MVRLNRFEQLRKVNIFSKLTDSQLLTFDGFFSEEEISKDTIFINQDDSPAKAYLIIDGAVRIYRITDEGDEITLGFKGNGEIIGEMALLDGKPRSAFVKTIKDTLFYTLRRDHFLSIINQNPQIALNLINSLTVTIRNMDKMLEDSKSQNLYERTLAILQSLAVFFENRDIIYSQEELATIVGATRSRVTEVLHDLQRDRKITLSHKRIHLL